MVNFEAGFNYIKNYQLGSGRCFNEQLFFNAFYSYNIIILNIPIRHPTDLFLSKKSNCVVNGNNNNNLKGKESKKTYLVSKSRKFEKSNISSLCLNITSSVNLWYFSNW